MSRNPFNLRSRAPMEWSAKGRKEESRLRGFRRRGRADAIVEAEAQMAHAVDADYDDELYAEFLGEQ